MSKVIKKRRAGGKGKRWAPEVRLGVIFRLLSFFNAGRLAHTQEAVLGSFPKRFLRDYSLGKRGLGSLFRQLESEGVVIIYQGGQVGLSPKTLSEFGITPSSLGLAAGDPALEELLALIGPASSDSAFDLWAEWTQAADGSP